jgi:hypothetical protein
VAAIDRERVLSVAGRALDAKALTVTSLPCPRSPGTAHDYYSEIADEDTASGAGAKGPGPDAAYTAHRDAVFALGLRVPALAAAYTLTGEARYAAAGAADLRAWFVEPATRMTPRMDFAGVQRGQAGAATGTYAGIVETVPLVEVAQAVGFLAAWEGFLEADLAAVTGWFAEYLKWLTEAQDSGPRLAALARDRRDHHGTSWLMQVAAYTLLTLPENGAPKVEAKAMEELRRRFRTVTLRAQISAEGTFPRELQTDVPYRNSLFNLDMLALCCQMLSTRFESVWEYALEDGPSMRGAIAYHFPFIADRSKWPFKADVAHFGELPGRRVSLLLTARAYQRPEYAALWKVLTAGERSLEVERTIPVHQPLLWVRGPRTKG